METIYLFYALFLSQVLLISYFLPRQLLGRVRHVVDNYPPERYPRLYPVSLAQAKRAQRFFRLMNLAVLALGLGLIVRSSSMSTPSSSRGLAVT